jgi:hypothetical protein
MFLALLVLSLAEPAVSLDAVHLSDLVSTLNIDTSSALTVSGVSSGGMMAVQMHIAFSSVINGAAVFAGGPYYCANSNLVTATENCMKGTFGGPPVSELVAFTNEQSVLHTIDNVSNLEDDFVYLFAGTLDSVVDPSVGKALKTYYSYFLPEKNIKDEFGVVAEHCVPTLHYNGEACDVLSSPYLGNCGYDGAGVALQTLYPDVTAPGASYNATGQLHEFLQTEFFPYHTGSTTNSLDDTGFVYVPTQCLTASGATRCKVHLSFHGCEQGQAEIGSDYAAHAGFNSWADANDMVVVYPYAQKDSLLGNPNGCWDWWGYTNTAYGLQSGIQMAFAKKIIDTVYVR